MGAFDELKGLAKKAQDLADEHPDQVKEALQKAEHAVNEQTGGKYHDQLAKAEGKAEQFVDKQQHR